MIADAHERVRGTLTEKRPFLDALARLLLTQEVVERPMLEELLARPASGAPALSPPVAAPAAAASAIDGSLGPPSRGR